jgi:hypothetical protein
VDDEAAAPEQTAPPVASLGVVLWRRGVPTVDLLGHSAPHAMCQSWAPERYPYRPAA